MAQTFGGVEGNRVSTLTLGIGEIPLPCEMVQAGLVRSSMITREICRGGTALDEGRAAKSRSHKAAGAATEVRAAHSTPRTGKPCTPDPQNSHPHSFRSRPRAH